MDAYNIPDALSPILPFLDDASNWFVRRSRRRFWKSEDDGDKNDAYKTLHYVLVRLSYILAPFTPFLAEELYHNLTGDDESIHLKNWWSAGRVDDIVTGQMESVRIVVNIGLAQRAKAGIKVRQPLTLITLYGEEFDFLGESDRVFDYIGLIKEELNVHQVKLVLQPMKSGDEKVKFDLQITPELKREGLSREVIRFVQSTRKNAGLNVDDRIHLSLLAEDEELSGAIAEHHDEIYAETLAVDEKVAGAEAEVVKIDGIELKIALEKA
jgi:isoleucyl-tRNA synthetase